MSGMDRRDKPSSVADDYVSRTRVAARLKRLSFQKKGTALHEGKGLAVSIPHCCGPHPDKGMSQAFAIDVSARTSYLAIGRRYLLPCCAFVRAPVLGLSSGLAAGNRLHRSSCIIPRNLREGNGIADAPALRQVLSRARFKRVFYRSRRVENLRI